MGSSWIPYAMVSWEKGKSKYKLQSVVRISGGICTRLSVVFLLPKGNPAAHILFTGMDMCHPGSSTLPTICSKPLGVQFIKVRVRPSGFLSTMCEQLPPAHPPAMIFNLRSE